MHKSKYREETCSAMPWKKIPRSGTGLISAKKTKVSTTNKIRCKKLMPFYYTINVTSRMTRILQAKVFG
jgi:hypothetical protein